MRRVGKESRESGEQRWRASVWTLADGARVQRWRINRQDVGERRSRVGPIGPVGPQRDQDPSRIQPGRAVLFAGRSGDEQRHVRVSWRRGLHASQPEPGQAANTQGGVRIVRGGLCKRAGVRLNVMPIALERRGHLVENQEQQQRPAQCETRHIQASGQACPFTREDRRTPETMWSECTHGRQCTRRKSRRRAQTDCP